MAFATRFENALSLGFEDDDEEEVGDARRSFEGVGLDGIVSFVEARGEVGILGSRGERERRRGEEERGDDMAGK